MLLVAFILASCGAFGRCCALGVWGLVDHVAVLSDVADQRSDFGGDCGGAAGDDPDGYLRGDIFKTVAVQPAQGIEGLRDASGKHAEAGKLLQNAAREGNGICFDAPFDPVQSERAQENLGLIVDACALGRDHNRQVFDLLQEGFGAFDAGKELFGADERKIIFGQQGEFELIREQPVAIAQNAEVGAVV